MPGPSFSPEQIAFDSFATSHPGMLYKYPKDFFLVRTRVEGNARILERVSYVLTGESPWWFLEGAVSQFRRPIEGDEFFKPSSLTTYTHKTRADQSIRSGLDSITLTGQASFVAHRERGHVFLELGYEDDVVQMVGGLGIARSRGWYIDRSELETEGATEIQRGPNDLLKLFLDEDNTDKGEVLTCEHYVLSPRLKLADLLTVKYRVTVGDLLVGSLAPEVVQDPLNSPPTKLDTGWAFYLNKLLSLKWEIQGAE